MRILVDADACPVVSIVEKTAKKYEIPVVLLCDTNHVLYSDYSEVITVGARADAVDFKLVSLCQKGDIVVTQDYGVAAMILGKSAYGIHQSGKWYTNGKYRPDADGTSSGEEGKKCKEKASFERSGKTDGGRWSTI